MYQLATKEDFEIIDYDRDLTNLVFHFILTIILKIPFNPIYNPAYLCLYMRIAVDAGFLKTDETTGFFIKEIFFRLAKQHAEHQFIFLLSVPVNALPDLPGNVIPVIITPAPTNFILYKWWYDIKVPSALKRYKADVFVCTRGLCSLTSKIPQVLIVQNFAFLKYPAFFDKSSLLFYKKYTSRFLKKAAAIASFSDFTKKEIISTYAVPEQKITVINIAADSAYKPLDWEERERIKEQYAQGCEYFIFTGDRNSAKNLIHLLKAFSIFKKWQKTNMKLVITINSSGYKDQSEKLNSYKYKKEISLAENLSVQELAKVTAGAYAMIYPSLFEGFGLPVLEALLCEVPVITSAGSSMSEVAGEAGLYADPESPEEIAEQMKRIFKDEALRNKLISVGKERARAYSLDKTVAAAWLLIQQAVSK